MRLLALQDEVKRLHSAFSRVFCFGEETLGGFARALLCRPELDDASRRGAPPLFYARRYGRRFALQLSRYPVGPVHKLTRPGFPSTPSPTWLFGTGSTLVALASPLGCRGGGSGHPTRRGTSLADAWPYKCKTTEEEGFEPPHPQLTNPRQCEALAQFFV